MKKNMKKSTTRNTYRQHVDFPEVVDMDTLNYMNDDELGRRLDLMLSEREKAVQSDIDPLPWEQEICYAQREVRIRLARRLAHDKYLRSHPDAGASFAPSFDEETSSSQLN